LDIPWSTFSKKINYEKGRYVAHLHNMNVLMYKANLNYMVIRICFDIFVNVIICKIIQTYINIIYILSYNYGRYFFKQVKIKIVINNNYTGNEFSTLVWSLVLEICFDNQYLAEIYYDSMTVSTIWEIKIVTNYKILGLKC